MCRSRRLLAVVPGEAPLEAFAEDPSIFTTGDRVGPSRRKVRFSAATSVVVFEARQAPVLIRKEWDDSAGGARERACLALSCELVGNEAHRLEQRGARVFSEAELDRLLQGDEVGRGSLWRPLN
jgi:hypothetical protein